MKKKMLLLLLFTIIGASAGYAYYHYVGCMNGTCAIWANPYRSTAYGGIMGLLLVWTFLPGKKK